MNTVVRKDDVFVAFALGTAANFPWEMAHSLLYRNTAGFTWQEHLLCCGLASLVDGVGIAAIFGVGAVAFREPRWTRRTTPLRWSAAALMGLAGAVATEKLALRLDWWAYGPAMPRVPGSDLGVSPLVQFVVLPMGVLFWALPRLWNRQKESGRDAGS